MKPSPSLIVTGGGTGGHIMPGVAIADEWKRRYPDSKIVFVGARGALEEKLVPRAGYPLELVDLGSLKRVSLGRRIKTLVQIPLALLKAATILLRLRPVAVMGIGGYASGPVVLMARLIGWLWGVRIAIIEQNAVPGFTNRILGKFAHRVFCAFPGIDRRFPAGKALVTGNPIRKEMLPADAAPREPFKIFITGGSQGAVGMNSLVLGAVPLLGELRSRIEILHQAGEKDQERVAEAYRKIGFPARVEKFVDEMKAAFDQSSLLICRAGANTLAEVAAVGRASILVPLPTSADGHQEKNARLFTDSGAAILLNQTTATPEDLARIIRDLIEHPEKVTALESSVRRMHQTDATGRIVSALAGESR